MAKISARGATEVAKLRARSQVHHNYTYLYVLTSDGRVLVRATGAVDVSGGASGYSLLGKVSKSQTTEAYLRDVIRKHGREVY